MTYQVLDTVVLARDVDEHGLRKGDLGAVVEVYEPDGLEVEFVTGRITTHSTCKVGPGDEGVRF